MGSFTSYPLYNLSLSMKMCTGRAEPVTPTSRVSQDPPRASFPSEPMHIVFRSYVHNPYNVARAGSVRDVTPMANLDYEAPLTTK